MSTEANVRTIQGIYEAFGRGDVPAILDRLSEGVRWEAHLDPIVPWGGDYSGKTNVPRFFDAIARSADILSFEPREFVAEGDRVVSLGTFGFRAKATGREMQTRWIFVWTVKDGVVTSYEQFHQPGIADAFR